METIGDTIKRFEPDFDFSPVIREWASEIPKELDFRTEVLKVKVKIDESESEIEIESRINVRIEVLIEIEILIDIDIVEKISLIMIGKITTLVRKPIFFWCCELKHCHTLTYNLINKILQ